MDAEERWPPAKGSAVKLHNSNSRNLLSPTILLLSIQEPSLLSGHYFPLSWEMISLFSLFSFEPRGQVGKLFRV